MPTPPPTEASLAKGIPSVLTALAWLMLVGARAFGGVGEALVALGIAGVVPLGLQLTSRVRCPQSATSSNEATHATQRTEMVRRAIALASPLGMASFAFPVGALAAALATPWLLATVLVGMLGLSRLGLERGPRSLAVLALDVGCLYLPIGGAWYWASRAGISPLGFHEPVVLFTATHFHFAGFAAPVVAGLVGIELGLGSAPADSQKGGPELAEPTSTALRRIHGLSACVVMGGVPLVAVGITVSRALEAPAAMLLGTGMLILASLLALTGLRRLFGPSNDPSLDPASRGRLVSFRRRLSGLLFVLSGLSLVGSMMLAIAFTLTGSAGRGAEASWIPYATMAAFHGIANAVGFAGCALLGFLVSPSRSSSRSSAVSAELGPMAP